MQAAAETITVPNNTTTTARIKVEAVGNIYFDINNANFAIAAAPTAASVSVAGRVFSSRRRAVSGAQIYLTDQDGNARAARTNAFGYFRFSDLEAGRTYVVTVKAKGHQFEQQAVTLNDNLANLNIWAR